MFARAEAETDRVSIPNSRAPGAHRCDPSAISEVIAAAFRDHSAAIHGTALRSTRDPELAADVTQEAFLRLVVEAQAGRFPDNVGGWLYRTSANLIISRARRAAVARRLAPDPSEGGIDGRSISAAARANITAPRDRCGGPLGALACDLASTSSRSCAMR